MAIRNAAIEQRARSAVTALERYAPVRAAYLFGSHTTGEAREWSDVDVAAFVEGLENWDIRRRARTIAQVQAEIGDDIELHLFPTASLVEPQRGSFPGFIQQHGIRL